MTSASSGRGFRAAAVPRLRGALHAVAFPVAVTAGVVLVCWPRPRWRAWPRPCTGYLRLLFGVSAAYHRGISLAARTCCTASTTPTST